jgi:DNA gyrase inhibitor GyrI
MVNELEVRIVELNPMRVASTLGFGTNPEEQASEKIQAYAEKHQLLHSVPPPRIFGFDNPEPTTGSPNYGYEVWMTVGPEANPEEGIEIKEIPAGLYAVTRFKGLQHIGKTWQRLLAWQQQSPYALGSHQCLEELLTPQGIPYEEYIFDLYLPVVVQSKSGGKIYYRSVK